MTLIAIIAVAWIAVLGAVVALCRGASRGDAVLAAGAEELRRHELSAGVVRLEHTAADGIGFMAPRKQGNPAVGDDHGGCAPRRGRPSRSVLAAR